MKQYLFNVSMLAFILFFTYIILALIMVWGDKHQKRNVEKEKKLIEDCKKILQEEKKYGVGRRTKYGEDIDF